MFYFNLKLVSLKVFLTRLRVFSTIAWISLIKGFFSHHVKKILHNFCSLILHKS